MADVSKGRKIGIMGGTFDPIHYGHLMLAEQIRTSFSLDEIIFIPVGKAPHKKDSKGANKHQRFDMTLIAVASNPYFSVSDIEVKRNAVTYTVDTIKTLKEKLSPVDQLYFITGADAILLLETWKNYEELIHLVNFIGATRPGVDTERLSNKINMLQEQHHVNIEICYIPALAISSTDIRERVNQDKSIKYLLPEAVENYIYANRLYFQKHVKYDKLNSYLKINLSQKRYNHSLETSKLSRKLALIHGVDPIKAEMAGLCHDLAKELPLSETKKYIDKFGIYKAPCIQENPNLAHGEIAAELLKNKFGIDDEDILNAVRWHTYGHKDMQPLSKVVYVADIIEPSRKFQDIDKLRVLANESLDRAILYFFDLCTTYLNKKNAKIHEYTYEMLSSLKR